MPWDKVITWSPLLGLAAVRLLKSTCCALLSQVFGNNYRRPVIGYAQDVDAMGTQEVARFFERWAPLAI
jgi:hypothetical protein